LPALLVDQRQDPKFTKALTEFFSVTERTLKTGDLVWTSPLGTVGIEDKCVADLAASQSNKRLDDELRRLVDSYAVPILFVRGYSMRGSIYRAARDEASIANTLLGRQFHGVYTFQVAAPYDEAAEGLWRLHEYLALPRRAGIEGVRRERKFAFSGPLGPREETIYGILGMTSGVRNRRSIAVQIAKSTPLSEFLRWTAWDFEAQGFTRHMSAKLAGLIRTLEEPPSKSSMPSHLD
jgi:hypothetical protein